MCFPSTSSEDDEEQETSTSERIAALKEALSFDQLE